MKPRVRVFGPDARVGRRVDERIARGAWAEERAARELVRRGYSIVERNFRCTVGELDIIARHGRDLVFVEVRSRRAGTTGTGIDAIGYAKRRRVANVARMYLAMKRPNFHGCRFDVVGITGDDIIVIADAWRLGDGS